MSAGAPYREATRVRAFRASYWPEPEWTVLVALFSTLLAALCTLPLARRLTSLDAACAYENARPVCQIRTSGLLSTRTWTLSTIPATESGHGFAERAPADEVWSRFGDRGWKALGLGSLRGFGLRLARGCTEQIALSSSEAGGYFEVSAAAEALNRFFAVSGSTVSFHYGPWGAMPFALGAFAAVTGTLAMGILAADSRLSSMSIGPSAVWSSSARLDRSTGSVGCLQARTSRKRAWTRTATVPSSASAANRAGRYGRTTARRSGMACTRSSWTSSTRSCGRCVPRDDAPWCRDGPLTLPLPRLRPRGVRPR